MEKFIFISQVVGLGVFTLIIVIIMTRWFIISLRYRNRNKPKKEKKSDFNIRHYPRTGIYVAMYKGDYLDQLSTTGLLRLHEDLFFATKCNSIEMAIDLIEKFKEQKFNKNVEDINYE